MSLAKAVAQRQVVPWRACSWQRAARDRKRPEGPRVRCLGNLIDSGLLVCSVVG
jgi:hypothetical protein